MAFTCGFYNSVNHDRKYDAVQHGMVFDGIITDGIYATYLKAMVVKASSNPSEVIVQPGRAWFNHTWSYNDADYPVAAPDPEVVLDRIDTLVLDINSEDAVRDNQFLWVQGTPTSQIPEPPELIHTATHNQYPLCDVYRQAGTTQIYAADITNRVGTSDCPFVTGVLEGINIDDLLAQWDDEFHTWENATKASFEGWMLNQQAVYSAWWDSLKTQMAGDVADVEEWVQTIKDIIDEETATHLQLEIDEINSMLPSGSHITVTTTDTELYSRSVTITDEDNNTVTSQFDATGVAVFKSVPYVGNLTIEATDGIRTATAVVNTPYFARYEFPLAFWSATVNITADTELGGETVTITDSSQILVGMVVLNASGTGVFNATYPDTYKFSVTHGGQTMEVSLAVTQETTYNVTIPAGFKWRGWVDTARDLDSTDYNSLDDVLADELAVRELCLEHACVDYLANVPTANEDVETIINNDLFAKWVNNSDYSLDVLGANVAIKALMDTADKYGYGEWCLMPQVPKMTANNAPYGEVFASGIYQSGYEAYKAFDGNDSSAWISNNTSPGVYIGYKFDKPTKIERYKWAASSYDGLGTITYKFQASNDGTNWVDLDEYTERANYTPIDRTINDSDYYLYYRFLETALTTSHASRMLYVQSITLYAWAPKGNVPVMTSNNAPYGTAFASSANSGYEAYRVFDGSDVSWSSVTGNVGEYVGYIFTSPIKANKAHVRIGYTVASFVIKASNTPSDQNSFVVISDTITNPAEYGTFADIDVELNTNDFYLAYELVTVSHYSGDTFSYNVRSLQFYGRELSVSVPTMTGNTTPYGEVSASSRQKGYDEYKAFDNNTSTRWNSSMAATVEDIGYEFTQLVKPKMASVTAFVAQGLVMFTHGYIQGFDESSNTWDNLAEVTNNDGNAVIVPITSTKSYKRLRLHCDGTNYHSGNYENYSIVSLQFYGLDYSEKEFEQGTTKKWLYDHGVELETLVLYTTGASVVVAEKHDNYIELMVGSTESQAKAGCTVNLTNYNLMRAKVGDELYDDTSAKHIYFGCATSQAASQTSYASVDPPLANLQLGLDISSITGNMYVSLGATYKNSKSTWKELWLE